nr:NADH dehydrogenase subunit 1 [Kradibia gibbosae]
MNMMLCMFDTMIMVLISVSFVSLLERKILSSIQLRVGPNKSSIKGMLQSFSDAIKLMIKEKMFPINVNYLLYLFSPIMMVVLMMLMWMNSPYYINFINNYMHMMMILCILSMGVYPLMISGWSSGSIYALIGSLRSIAQTISYEVSMIFIMFSMIMFTETFNLLLFCNLQKYSWFIFLFYPISFMLFISFLAELNRTPFDLAEGESELVSGFNIEYMGMTFAMIFMAEYGMILFMSYLFSIFFLGGNINSMMFYLMFLIMAILIIWVRGTFPRIRYDQMMMMMWKKFLPFTLCYLIILVMIKMMILLMII